MNIFMGRLVREEEIIKKNVQSYLEQTTSELTKYLEGNPTFVTFYTKNTLASTQDVGLESVQELVGSESPIKYNKIENFTLYGLDTLTVDMDNTDFGIDSNVEGDAVIIPNTIKPLTDDYFIINYNGNDFLFKVSRVTVDKINGKKF